LNLAIFPLLSAVSQLVVVAVVIYRRNRLGREMMGLGVYFLVTLVVTAIQAFLAFNRISNVWTIQVFTPIQFAMLMYVFYLWNRGSTAGAIILYAIFIFVVVWLISVVVLGSLADLFAYSDPISGAVLIFTSSYTLMKVERTEDKSVFSIPAFWVSSATVVYFGSTLVFSSLSSALWRAPMTTMQLAWSLQAVMNIVANLLYAGGFLCLRQKT
jgi:hypothetical protein